MKGFYITVKNGLLDSKHFKTMHGDRDSGAVWLFLWLLDKMTIIDEEKGEGSVLGGRPIKFEDFEKEIPVCDRTYRRWIDILRNGRYIETKRTPYGLIFTVFKAFKVFGQKIDKNRSVVTDRSLLDRSVVRDRSNYNTTGTGILKGDNNTDKNRNIAEVSRTVFQYWNSKNIVNHKELNDYIKINIRKLLKEMTLEEIMHGIDVYDSVLKDPDCFFKYKWNLTEFLGRQFGCRVFATKKREDYLKQSIKNKTAQKALHIVLDVSKNIQRVYEDGKLVKVVPIDNKSSPINLNEEEQLLLTK